MASPQNIKCVVVGDHDVGNLIHHNYFQWSDFSNVFPFQIIQLGEKRWEVSSGKTHLLLTGGHGVSREEMGYWPIFLDNFPIQLEVRIKLDFGSDTILAAPKLGRYLEIHPRGFPEGKILRVDGNLEGGRDELPDTSRVLEEYRHSLIINPIPRNGSGNPPLGPN